MAACDSTRVLILRLWFEDGGATDLRARIVTDAKLGNADGPSESAASVDQILSIVRRWVENQVTQHGGARER